MKKELLEHRFAVSSADVDSKGNFKLAALLSLCQEVAYMHSTRLGFGYERLHALDLAWVLSRAQVDVERMPAWREEVIVKTWHKRQSGLYSLRDYTLETLDGEPLVKVTTSWLIINIATRRITRLDRVPQGDRAIEFCTYDCDAIENEAPRLDAPEGGYSLDSHRVRYSDIDLNQHVNNAKYVEWLIDRLPRSVEGLRRFVINFNHEALLDQIVDMQAAQEQDIIYVSGNCTERNIFVARLSY